MYADDYHRQENTAASELPPTVGSQKSVKDSFDFEFQSRLHECETATAKGIGLSFYGKSVRICVPAFLLPESWLKLNDWLDEKSGKP